MNSNLFFKNFLHSSILSYFSFNISEEFNIYSLNITFIYPCNCSYNWVMYSNRFKLYYIVFIGQILEPILVEIRLGIFYLSSFKLCVLFASVARGKLEFIDAQYQHYCSWRCEFWHYMLCS
jgi:hypothetical protein